MPARVLIVDDSAAYRGLLTRLLQDQPGIFVVGEASSAQAARTAIKSLKPDVLTLDVEMPGMDGIAFLEKLMRLHPLPVVMVSSAARHRAEVVLEALALGAVDFVPKPEQADPHALFNFAEQLAGTLRAAAGARLGCAEPDEPVPAPAPLAGRAEVIALGASTGGTEAIARVLRALPGDVPPVLIVQHLPDRFVPAFAKRLERDSGLIVALAEEGQPLQPGHAYMSPGDVHLAVARRQRQLVAALSSEERVQFHRPAVDVLFHAVARVVGKAARAALLTGMGKDGAAGMAAIRAAGGYTVAQDEASCVVYGMPGEAVHCGGACEILPLTQIAGRLAPRR